MRECPTIQELASFVEGTRMSPDIRDHVASCSACRSSLETLSGEVQHLQISISELWFKERISCLDQETLDAWRRGAISGPLADYVAFHVDELGCPFCQADLGQMQVRESAEDSHRLGRSREKVGEVTATFLRDLKR